MSTAKDKLQRSHKRTDYIKTSDQGELKDNILQVYKIASDMEKQITTPYLPISYDRRT